MKREISELYDYELLRCQSEATMFVVRLNEPTVVLGGNQSTDVLSPSVLDSLEIRRRRGGGGLVYLQPDDVWIDWWIPAGDARWLPDVRVSSRATGWWWANVLCRYVTGEVSVHEGPLTGALEHRVLCFAGRGPGEVFVDDRKAVGLTQWRVREGNFLSSVIHAHDSLRALELLRVVPDGLAEAVDHHTISSLGINNTSAVVDALADESGPWILRQDLLTP